MRVVATRPRERPAFTPAEKAARWREAHPERDKEVRDRQRTTRREWLAEIKREQGCAECGIDDPRVLDFHHEDASEKTLAVSQLVNRRSWQAVLDEIAKCGVLCANCHRIAHAEAAVVINSAGFFRAS